MRIPAITYTNQINYKSNNYQKFNKSPFIASDSVSFSGKIYNAKDPASKTIETIKSRNGIVPARIEKIVQELSSDDKKKDLPLAVVHKEAYRQLKDCKTLEEAKKLYPEFKDVKTPDEIQIYNKSYLYYLVNGQAGGAFKKGEDIPLKILQLYWSDLVSVRDFPRYVDSYSYDFESIFRKLNIPKFDYEYAQAIKGQKPRQGRN